MNHLSGVGETPLDARHIEVSAISLDARISTGIPAPSFIKIDVEGAEEAVLRGATGMLTTQHPPVAVEVREESAEPVERVMRDLGYEQRILGRERGITDLLYMR